MDIVIPAPKTQPRGALSPNLAEQLDRLSDQGRSDRVLSQLGLLNDSQIAHQHGQNDSQLALFSYNDAGDAVGYNGESL